MNVSQFWLSIQSVHHDKVFYFCPSWLFAELLCYDVRDEDDEFILVLSIDFLAGTSTPMINDLRVGVG